MHRFLSQGIVFPISHLRRRLRSDMKAAYRSYRAGLAFRHAAADWDTETKFDWILNSLRGNLRMAYAQTPYYKQLFNRIGFDPRSDFSFAEFSQIPILERESVARAGNEMLSDRIRPEERTKDATGGTTGVPTEIWLGPEERGWKESGMQYLFTRIGVELGDRIAYFWGHHLDPRPSEKIADRLRSFLANTRYYDCFRLSPQVYQAYHESFERYRPDCIVAYASALGQFAEYLRENRIKPKNYPNICFVTGAEKLYPSHRDAIEEVFGKSKPVFERYGGRDISTVALQTGADPEGAFEIDWAWALVEPETSETRTSVLVTKLHADAMPMIRYRVDDLAVFPTSSIPGVPAFSISEMVGRALDQIWLPDGRSVHGVELPHLMKDFQVKEFMLIQSPDYSVAVKIIPKPGFKEPDRQIIYDIITKNLPGLRIDINLVERIDRTKANKWRPVVSLVQR